MTIPAIQAKPVSPLSNRDNIENILDSVWAKPETRTENQVVQNPVALPGSPGTLSYTEDYIALDFSTGTPLSVYIQEASNFSLFDADNPTEAIANGGSQVLTEEVWEGDAVTGPEDVIVGGDTLVNFPVVPRTVVLIVNYGGGAGTNEVLAFDDGAGNLVDDGAGSRTLTAGSTINYSTGVISALTITGGAVNNVQAFYVGGGLRLDTLGIDFFPDPADNKIFYLLTSDTIPDTGTYANGVTINFGTKSLFRNLPTNLFLILGAAAPANPGEIYEALAALKGAEQSDWSNSTPLQGAGNDPVSAVPTVFPDWYHAGEVKNRLDFSLTALELEHFNNQTGAPGSWSAATPVGRHKLINQYFPTDPSPVIRTAEAQDGGGTLTPFEEAIKIIAAQGSHVMGINADVAGFDGNPDFAFASGDDDRKEVGLAGMAAQELAYSRTADASGWRIWLYQNTEAPLGQVPIIQAAWDPANFTAPPVTSVIEALRLRMGDPFVPVLSEYVRAAGSPPVGGLAGDAPPWGRITDYPNEVATTNFVVRYVADMAAGGGAGAGIPYIGIPTTTIVADFIGQGVGSPTGWFGWRLNPTVAHASFPALPTGFLVVPESTMESGTLMSFDTNGEDTNGSTAFMRMHYTIPGGGAGFLTGLDIDLSDSDEFSGGDITIGVKIDGLPTRSRAIQAVGLGDVYIGDVGVGSAYAGLNTWDPGTGARTEVIAGVSDIWSVSKPMFTIFGDDWTGPSGASASSPNPLARVLSNNVTGINKALILIKGTFASPTGNMGLAIDVTGEEWAARMNGPLDMGWHGPFNSIQGVAAPRNTVNNLDGAQASIPATAGEAPVLTGDYGWAAAKGWVDKNYIRRGGAAGGGAFWEVGSSASPWGGAFGSGINVWSRVNMLDGTDGNPSRIRMSLVYQNHLENPNPGGSLDFGGSPDYANNTDFYNLKEVSEGHRFNTNVTNNDGDLVTKGMVRSRIKASTAVTAASTSTIDTQWARTKLYFVDSIGAASALRRSELKMSPLYNGDLVGFATGSPPAGSITVEDEHVATVGYVNAKTSPSGGSSMKSLAVYRIEIDVTNDVGPMLAKKVNSTVSFEDGENCDVAVGMWPRSLLFDRHTQNSLAPATATRYGSLQIGGPKDQPQHSLNEFKHYKVTSRFYVPGVHPIAGASDRGGYYGINVPEIDGGSLSHFASQAPQGGKSPDASSMEVTVPGSQTPSAVTWASSAQDTVNVVYTNRYPEDLGSPYDGMKSAFISMRVTTEHEDIYDVGSDLAPSDLRFSMIVEKKDLVITHFEKEGGTAKQSYIGVFPGLRFNFINLNLDDTPGSVRTLKVILDFYVIGVDHNLIIPGSFSPILTTAQALMGAKV